MTGRIISVHPNITVVESDGQNIELPTGWFPVRPEVGQTWRFSFERQRDEREQLDELNRYIA